jgi:DNA-binding MarR family transcriptional regulator
MYKGEMRKLSKQAGRGLPSLPCTCANLRRAARAVSRLYNRELRPEGIEIAQFTLLMALDRTGEIQQGKLARILALDSTTLTRLLEPVRKQGWVEVKEGDDRRFRMIRLTKAGAEKYRTALRSWKRAQDRMQAALGETALAKLTGVLEEMTTVAAEG